MLILAKAAMAMMLGFILALIAGLILIALFVLCSTKKKDDRLSVLYMYLLIVNCSSYDLTLSWPFPYNLIPFIIAVAMGYWMYCSKKISAEWNEKERKGIVSSHKDIYEKQERDFKKLSPEEQEEWYQNYLKTAPPKLTLKSIIIINVGAYLFAYFFKLLYCFISI